MFLIIGLGNPGDMYAHTRHNAGFEVIDLLAQKYNIAVNRSRCHALIGEGSIAGARAALIKPQTYMNLSGDCVQAAMHWYKCAPEETFIVSDDIDLALGAVRVRALGGAGTHNGWRDILLKTGSERFPRARVGVGAPPREWDLADWVLSRYQGETEQALMREAFVRAAEAAVCFMQYGIERSMNVYNKKPAAQMNKKPAENSAGGADPQN